MKKKSLYPSPGCRKIIHFLVMKASFIFLLLLTLQIKANVYAQQLRLDLNLQNVTLKEVIQEIRRHSDFSFVYSDADLVGITQRNVQMKDATIEEVLKNCLQGTKLVYDITDKTIIIRKLDEVTQTKQVQVIQGQVTDVRGTPLPGVTVRIKGTQLGVSTDVNGKFRFELPDTKEVVLAFSFVGMKPLEVMVLAKGAMGEEPAYPHLELLEKGTDWFDEIFRLDSVRNYQIGLSGGAENVSYNLSVGFFQ